MGKKITQYTNNVSSNPDVNSLLDLSEKTGTTTYESRKWTLSAFKTWVNSWVVASSIAWADITGKPTTLSGYGITDAIDGSGTANRVPKFTDSNTLSDSSIRDNGTTTGFNVASNASIQAYLETTLQVGYQANLTGTNALNIADAKYLSGAGSVNVAYNCQAYNGTSNNVGGRFRAGASGDEPIPTSYDVGVIGAARNTTRGNIGGYFKAQSGTSNYALRLQDGTEGSGKFLKSTNANGDTNWATISVSDLSSFVGLPTEIQLAVSDETTALTTGTSKITFRMPYAMTVTEVRASLSTAQTSGSILTVDINDGGSSILSTKLTIDNTEKTSTTAATAAIISDSSLADDAEITIDIDQIGDGTAKGLKILIKGTRA